MSIDSSKQVSTFVMEVEIIENVIVNDEADENEDEQSELTTIDPTEVSESDDGTT